jgi:hypothetical protein
MTAPLPPPHTHTHTHPTNAQCRRRARPLRPGGIVTPSKVSSQCGSENDEYNTTLICVELADCSD